VVSRIPHAAATIVPFDVRNRLETIQRRRVAEAAQKAATPTDGAQEDKVPEPAEATQVAAGTGADGQDDAADAAHMARPEVAVADGAAAEAGQRDGSQYDRPAPPPGVRPLGTLTGPGRATVEGRVYAVEIRPVERNTVLAAEIADSTGQLTALFYGRSHIPGLECGTRVRFRGQVGMRAGGPVMINPAYELVAPGETKPRPAGGPAGDED
jgi:hypothetical protein